MNYKELLKKYINYIAMVEGATYLNDFDERSTIQDDIIFTATEWETLLRLDNERNAKIKAAKKYSPKT